MKKTSILAAAAGLAIATGLASAQVYSASPGLNTDDNTTLNSTINVAGGPATISDLNVLFSCTHTWDADLDVVLQGPSGYICLTTDNGGSGDNYQFTRFDDAATTSVTSGAAPFFNNFRPEGLINGWAGTPATFTGTNFASLAGFIGGSANGAWTLYVADDAAGDGGVFQYWSMEFNGAVDPNGPPPLTAPTNPSGVGSYALASVQNGDLDNFRVTVTPGSNPTSTGISVTVDGSALGLGTLTLLDDGINDDGIAGNNIFGKNNVVISGAEGPYTLPFTITDGQARTGSGNMPVLTIVPPPPACPEGLQPASFSNLASFDGLNAAGNAHPSLGWTGTDLIAEIHVSGRLSLVTTGTFASEARIQITFADASTIVLQPFTTASFTGFLDVADYVFTLPTPKFVSDITDVQLYESFNDATGVADSTWNSLCLTYAAQLSPTNPSITGSFTPNPVLEGGNVHVSATVTPGANPPSTNLSVVAAGGIVLLDDGIQDDGIAGNNIFGADANVGNQPVGVSNYQIVVTDGEGRTGDVQVPLTIIPRGQWEESIDGGGDAGELPGSAQIVTGADGPVASIGGDLSTGGTDMYAITICDPSTFSADLSASGRTNFDTQLWLFDANGNGVEFNDDTVGTVSVLDNSFVTSPGQYYIAVSGYNRDALDVNGALLWNNTPFTGVRAADGPGAANPVDSWTGTSATGTYLITLSGVCIQTAVPCDPDVNQDGNADQGDIDYLINVVAGGDNTTNIDPDFNHDGNVDQGDIDALINVVAGGNCP